MSSYHRMHHTAITIEPVWLGCLARDRLAIFCRFRPWGCPDMAYFLLTRAIFEDHPSNVFNHGKMIRNFSYIDDIVEGVYRVILHQPKPNPAWNGEDPDPASSYCPYQLYNMGNSQKVELMRYIEVLEECLGKKAQKNFLPLQPGNMPATYADVNDLAQDIDFRPNTSIEECIKRFVEWYKAYYKITV